MKKMKNMIFFAGRKVFCAALLFFVSVCCLNAQQTNFPGVFYYRLDNGLELFVVENSSAPLASIHIAAKTGAVSQTKENAGLFHLYEHMLFKGNAKYENELACNKAQNKMGAIDSNAYTSIDIVNYYFTVPSSELKNGLEFWSLAVRTPKFDEKELQNEIAVVLSEINADFSNPAMIRTKGVMKELFPECPWTLDAGGDPKIVAAATPEQMRKIQQEYYIPQNSAVFVGGDVKHQQVYEYVKEIFGDWKNTASVGKVIPSTKSPFTSVQKRVFVNPGLSDEIIQASYFLRGPDGETDAEDTYAADIWTNLCQNPSGKYVRSLVEEKSLSIPNSDYVAASYITRRASGIIAFSAAMLSGGPASVVEKSENFLSVLLKKVFPMMAEKNFAGEDSISSVIRHLEDSRIYELESASAVLSSLSFFWSCCNSDYFFGYDENLSKVTAKDVGSFVEKYIIGNDGLYVVSVSPALWEKYADKFKASGFTQITEKNAFWTGKGNE